MSFKDFLKRGTGLDLVEGDEPSVGKSGSVGKQNLKQKKLDPFDNYSKADVKVLRQLEVEVSKAIEKLEDIRDKLRVRRGY